MFLISMLEPYFHFEVGQNLIASLVQCWECHF